MATPVTSPPPPSHGSSLLLEALDTTAFHLALFGLLWSDAQAPPVPQALILGPGTQQVLNTGLQLQRSHSHSPSQGCFFGGGQLQLFSMQSKPSLVHRGLDQCCGAWGEQVGLKAPASEDPLKERAAPEESCPLHTLTGGWFLRDEAVP